MFSSRLISIGQRTFSLIPTPRPHPLGSHLTRQIDKKLMLLQRRCYAQPAKPTPKTTTSHAREEEHLKRQARAAAAGAKIHEIPEKLLIYHAGTGRITFLAMVKVTTLFIGAFFGFVVVPGYVKAEKPEWETAGVALAGLIPVLFIAYTTAPFVTHIHIALPASARASRAALERFVHDGLPPSAELTLTTMSAIAKPRYSSVRAGHLRPARRRFGLVNFVRDRRAAADENAARRWYNFRAVTGFHVQEPAPAPAAVKSIKAKTKTETTAKTKKSKVLIETWIWDAIKDRIAKRAAAAKPA